MTPTIRGAASRDRTSNRPPYNTAAPCPRCPAGRIPCHRLPGDALPCIEIGTCEDCGAINFTDDELATIEAAALDNYFPYDHRDDD